MLKVLLGETEVENSFGKFQENWNFYMNLNEFGNILAEFGEIWRNFLNHGKFSKNWRKFSKISWNLKENYKIVNFNKFKNIEKFQKFTKSYEI